VARKYYIETFGCQMNVHDSERMAGLIEQAGYELTDDVGDADLVLINTCSVREKAVDKLFGRLGELGVGGRERPLVAVTGCVAQQEGGGLLKRSANVDVVVGTQALRRLPLLVSQAVATGKSQVDVNPYDDVSFPLGIAVRNDPVKAYVTIIEGCNDFCAFCVVPYTRGHERMRPAGEILAEARQAAAAGHREVQLLGQIVNHYHDPDVPQRDFAWLLHQVHEIPGVERIRFASPHPRHVTSEMIAAMRDLPKVCKHLHLPLQSGSTQVLKNMRRRYSRETYLALVEQVRAAIPNIALSTDIIVGFPGETDGDFEATMSLVEAVGFHSMFSFKYSQRPNTLAEKRMPDTVSEAEKSARLMELQSRQKSIQERLHAGCVGQTVAVLVDSRSRKQTDVEMFSGRTTQNTVVNFPGRREWLGSILNVRVDSSGTHSLRGEVVGQRSVATPRVAPRVARPRTARPGERGAGQRGPR
jgi:tRNA-2-methylthio-N6-dimethylallyladenosine synthase